MEFESLISNFQMIEELLDSYESGDLIKVASLTEGLEKVYKEFDKYNELKKLNNLVNYLKQLSLKLTEVPEKEFKIISLFKDITSSFLSFFKKEISGKDLISRINEKSHFIKELIGEQKKEEKKEELYPPDYFKGIVQDEKLLLQFFHEANEHLDEAQYTLLELEYDSTNKELINNVFRNFHTIKGSSAFLGLKNIEEVSHKIEDLFALVRDEKITISRELIDVIFYGMELLRNLLDIMEANEYKADKMKSSFLKVNIFSYINLMKRILSDYNVKKIGEILEEEGLLNKGDLDKILEKQKEEDKKFGEVAIDEKKLTSEDLAEALKKQQQQKLKVKRMGYVKVSNEKLNSLIDLVGELVINQSMLKQEIVNSKASLNISDRNLGELENITTMIKNIVLSMGMLPIGDIFNKLRVVIRNTAEELGKVVVVETEGEETELDRNVMETIYDPLLHIVRNAIDHGIESPEERVKVGKDKIGKITLKAEHKGSGIEVIITDDGKGIDKEKILKKALELKIITPEQSTKMSDKDIYSLMFLPGFSTSENVTNVSGRGVGLDVVKKNLEEIHGRVEVQTEKGKYTKFIIKLPLTLAIIEGFVTKVGSNKYVFPFNLIEEILVLEKSSLKYSENGGKAMIFHRGIHVPVIFCEKIFKENILRESENFISLIVSFDQFKYCIVVDEVIGKQEIVIKNLGNILSEYSYFSGGTIFGDGTIGFVVDIQGLIEKAANL
ncbi:MAG: chemotaxis protein CheA [Brevinematales bacterium]|nr:chemotaxis protein CheA [Brevinematales bacterium]